MASFKAAQFTTFPQDSLEEYAKALDVEKARAEESERMYMVLKKIHEDCAEEFRVTQNQTQKLFGELEQRLQKSDEAGRELRRTIVEQARDISELRLTQLTPQKQEVLRLSVQAELEKQYHAKLRALHEDNTALKSKVAGLIYENSALTGDLETREVEFKRAKSDLAAKYERKLDDWKREKDAAALVVPAVDVQRHRQLQRDNEGLEVRVKAQQAEMETIRAGEAKRAEEAHATFKAQTQRVAELTLKVESLKAELDGQKRQTDALRVQVSELATANAHLHQRNELLIDEKLAFDSERESLLHRHQIELANERGKSVTEKTALKKEADSLSAEIEIIKGQLDSAKKTVELQRSTVTAKEHETQLKLNQLAQKHASDVALIEHQKHLAESNLNSAESRHEEREKVLATLTEDAKDEVRRAEAVSAGLRNELDAIKLRNNEYQRMETDFIKLTQSHASLQTEVSDLLRQIASTEKIVRAVQDEKGHLEQEIASLRNRHHEQQLDVVKAQAACEAKLQEAQIGWNEKRDSYVVYVRRQDEMLRKGKTRLVDLSEKHKALRKQQRTFRKKVAAVVFELVSVVNAKTALLDLSKGFVTPADYKSVLDELTTLKAKMTRLKSMAVPEATSLPAVPSGRVSRLASTKSISEHFDRAAEIKNSKPSANTESEDDLKELMERLKQLGLTDGQDGGDSSESSDVESLANVVSTMTKIPPAPSIG
ncbi:putative Centrosomal protein of 83 kDa [Hypsibius exemplaris]|uniref:Centrosomal protein of 83 kDa n=1 Tax=Hypsibius exemplaris TaxID=2072580 RepID=A0A1W0X6P6_HYPEX|nr:putative Centrosomal protein of 83 kDa [Hypsibius exemplaris]